MTNAPTYPVRLRPRIDRLTQEVRTTSWERVTTSIGLPEGPDVSCLHPGIDWTDVAASRSFGFASCTYGSDSSDEKSDWNRAGMAGSELQARGLIHHGRNDSPVAEASVALSYVPFLAPGECRVLAYCSDWETDAGWAVEFGTAIRKMRGGEPLGLRCSWADWEDLFMKDPRLLNVYDWLWIAAYGHRSPFGQVPKCRLWQFSDGVSPVSRETPGIGICGSSYFDGDTADLWKLVGPAPSIAPCDEPSLLAS